MKILVFGSLNIDHNYKMEHIVLEKETVFANQYFVVAGGKGLNASIALSKSGSHVYLAGNIGNDGEVLQKTLDKYHVDTTYLNHIDQPNGHAIIQVDQKGENAIFIYGGSNQAITTEYIDEVLSHFQPNDLIVLQNEINNQHYLITQAKKHGLTILLNPSPFNQTVLTYPLDLVDYIFINEVEGHGFTNESEPERILDKLKEMYPNTKIVLTLGSKGAYYQDNANRIFSPAYKVKAIDTVGAGDTFMGYFCYGLANSLPIEETLKIASQAASITCTKQGAADSIPTLQQVKEIYK